jgi:hypothetical protein
VCFTCHKEGHITQFYFGLFSHVKNKKKKMKGDKTSRVGKKAMDSRKEKNKSDRSSFKTLEPFDGGSVTFGSDKIKLDHKIRYG